MKQDLDKLLATRFIVLVEEATWLFLIVVVLKKKRKFQICLNFWKLNVATKMDSYPLHFIEEVLNMVAEREVYLFLDGFSNYHRITITSDDRYNTTFIINWGVFVCIVMPFGLKNDPPTY
jgi:hypothetical protein